MHSVQPQVADHYNQIRQKSREERQSSEIIGYDERSDCKQRRLIAERLSHWPLPLLSSVCSVKRFNNWVKSVLIQRYACPAATALDLCCGKGGDLLKFKKANVRYYVGADHALQSIKDAMSRYNDVTPLPFKATFICADCHSVSTQQQECTKAATAGASFAAHASCAVFSVPGSPRARTSRRCAI